MTKLDREKAKRRDRAPNKRRLPRRYPDSPSRGLMLDSFVKKHRIGCFQCKAKDATWAKTGISARGPWVICVPCVKKSKKGTTATNG